MYSECISEVSEVPDFEVQQIAECRAEIDQAREGRREEVTKTCELRNIVDHYNRGIEV